MFFLLHLLQIKKYAMGRKVQITRQMILDGAFKLLRTEGAENISYRKLATYTGCSTQPIAWQFETIERLRIELFHYVFENMLAIVPQRVEGDSELKYLVDVNCFQFNYMIDEPNLSKFIRFHQNKNDIVALSKTDPNPVEISNALSKELNITLEQAQRVVNDSIIFNQGIVSLSSLGLVNFTKEEARERIISIITNNLQAYGVSGELCKKLIS